MPQSDPALGAAVALDGLILQVEGGICAVLGPNGAGKSTLLKVLAGLLRVDSGEVSVAGFDPAERSIDFRRIIGVMPDDLGLFDSLTVAEHLEMAGPIYGLSRQETKQRAAGLIRLLALEPFAGTFADRCSEGTRKKTALALALLHNPRVLLLDEPFEGVDPVVGRNIHELLNVAAARGITVLLTSHSLSSVERLNATVVMLQGGHIVWQSSESPSPRRLDEVYFELVQPPALEDLPWLGNPEP